MKKQIIVIHWGYAKENHNSFEDSLRNMPFNPIYKDFTLWTKTLNKALWDDYNVFAPQMPNHNYAEYKYWKIVFEQVLEYASEEIIFVAHSLWWTFLAKYLNENKINKKIKAIFMVSPVFSEKKEILWSFDFDKNLTNLKNHENIMTFYHSTDDEIVDYHDMLDYKKVLPKADYKTFENRGHFIEERMHELEKDIKSIK